MLYKTRYQIDSEYSDLFLPAINDILQENASIFTIIQPIRKTHFDDDVSCIGDVEIPIHGAKVLCRVRRLSSAKEKRDLTLRAYSNDNKTELDKIKDGNGTWYFYGWADPTLFIIEWVIINLNNLRSSGLLDKYTFIIMNKDGETGFIAIPIQELISSGAAIKYYKSNDSVPSYVYAYINSEMEVDRLRAYELCEQYNLDYNKEREVIHQRMISYVAKSKRNP